MYTCIEVFLPSYNVLEAIFISNKIHKNSNEKCRRFSSGLRRNMGGENVSQESTALSFFHKKIFVNVCRIMQNSKCKMTKCAHPASRDLAEFNNFIYLERT